MHRSVDHEQIEKRDGAVEFDTAVASLADGGLVFPPPFDLSSSAALAANLDIGSIAEELFTTTAARDSQFSVRIGELIGDQPELGQREILDTAVGSTTLLIALLEMLIVELRARQQETGE